MDEYRVTWIIDIGECDSPREAAEKALMIQRNALSIATEFQVQKRLPGNMFSEAVTVDFYEESDSYDTLA